MHGHIFQKSSTKYYEVTGSLPRALARSLALSLFPRGREEAAQEFIIWPLKGCLSVLLWPDRAGTSSESLLFSCAQARPARVDSFSAKTLASDFFCFALRENKATATYKGLVTRDHGHMAPTIHGANSDLFWVPSFSFLFLGEIFGCLRENNIPVT